MGRAPCCDKTKVKRGPWSPEEDNILKNYLENYGSGGNWIALPQKAGLKRCGKSCRLRWLNYLRPNIKHGGFTEEEDNIILTIYNSIGSRWSVIASQLPGRTDNDVKNYWNTKLKKKLLSAAEKATPSITTNNLFITSTTNYNLVPSKATSVETISNRTSNYSIDNSIRPNNILSYLPMHVAADQIPLPGLREAPENLENPFSSGLFLSAPVSQEAVSSISPSFSLDNNETSASWSTNGSGEDDTFLAELLGPGLMPYDILNAFDFEEQLTDQINYHPNFSYSSESIYTTEVQQHQPEFHDSL